MGNRVGRHKKSKHERIRSKSVTQGGARSSNYRRKRSITRRMSSKSTPERLGVERKIYSDSQSISLSSRLQQERHSLSQVSDFSISSNVFSKDDTCGFELKPIELCSTYNRLVAIEGLREYFIEQNIVPFYRFFYSIIMDEDNDEIEWRSFVVVHKGDKHPFHIRDHHKAPEDPDALREIIPSISKYPNPAGSGHSTASNSRKNSDTSLSHVGWTAGWNSKRFPPPAFPDPLPDFSRYLFKCISHVSDDFQVFSAMGFIFSAYFADSRRRPAPTNHPNEKDALLSFPKVIHHRSLLPTSW
eukprot:134661_1